MIDLCPQKRDDSNMEESEKGPSISELYLKNGASGSGSMLMPEFHFIRILMSFFWSFFGQLVNKMKDL